LSLDINCLTLWLLSHWNQTLLPLKEVQLYLLSNVLCKLPLDGLQGTCTVHRNLMLPADVECLEEQCDLHHDLIILLGQMLLVNHLIDLKHDL
jgi:hypothetical protein